MSKKPIYPAKHEVTLEDGTKKFVCDRHLAWVNASKIEQLPVEATISCSECQGIHAND